ncbi:hypothetical protein HY251_07725 [bacterium]|nr:hypothetical protein [bacterium]
MDQDDLLTNALEPGEKVVWIDRPHGLTSCVRIAFGKRKTTAYPAAACLATSVFSCCVFFAGSLVVLATERNLSSDDLFFLTVVTVGSASWALFGAGVTALLLLPACGARYSVTDRGHGFMQMGSQVSRFDIPRLGEIAAPPDGEYGDLDLGVVSVARLDKPGRSAREERVTFFQVSNPVIALETIRVAASHVPREDDPGPP